MQQIMNYLSNIHDTNSILLVSSSEEFMELIPYFLEVKGVGKIYCINNSRSLNDGENIYRSDAI